MIQQLSIIVLPAMFLSIRDRLFHSDFYLGGPKTYLDPPEPYSKFCKELMLLRRFLIYNCEIRNFVIWNFVFRKLVLVPKMCNFDKFKIIALSCFNLIYIQYQYILLYPPSLSLSSLIPNPRHTSPLLLFIFKGTQAWWALILKFVLFRS